MDKEKGEEKRIKNLVERQVKLQEGVLYYQEGGSGEALVLVHGLSGSTRWWAKNVPALIQHYHLYLIDLFGFGRGHGQRFVLEKAARIISSWLEAVGIYRADFIGHSMGGYITASLAADFPEQVSRLVLVDALSQPVGKNYIRHTWDLLNAIRFMALDFLPVLISDAFRAGPRTMARASLEVMAADLRKDLHKIEAPVLILWGKNDTILPLSIGEELHTLIPRSQFVVIPGAGHNPMWDRPLLFNKAVLEFLGTGETLIRQGVEVQDHVSR